MDLAALLTMTAVFALACTYARALKR